MAQKIQKYFFDPITLIELIEERPCIWDKTVEDYKNRVKRTEAWMEIYELLIENFTKLQEPEKVELGK